MNDKDKKDILIKSEASRKFRNGDSLSDEELVLLLSQYKALKEALSTLFNPDYNLMYVDALHKHNKLLGYYNARKEQRARR